MLFPFICVICGSLVTVFLPEKTRKPHGKGFFFRVTFACLRQAGVFRGSACFNQCFPGHENHLRREGFSLSGRSRLYDLGTVELGSKQVFQLLNRVPPVYQRQHLRPILLNA
jgi:hypothetical protein